MGIEKVGPLEGSWCLPIYPWTPMKIGKVGLLEESYPWTLMETEKVEPLEGSWCLPIYP
jgi:hypothetical protein